MSDNSIVWISEVDTIRYSVTLENKGFHRGKFSKILFKWIIIFVYFKIDNSILEASFKAKKFLLSLPEQNL